MCIYPPISVEHALMLANVLPTMLPETKTYVDRAQLREVGGVQLPSCRKM